MRKTLLFLIIAALSVYAWGQPLPAKLKHTIIIDTDGAIDDMRAISILLARPEITIKAILLSDGSLLPDESAEKVCSLIHEFGEDNIPVAKGNTLKDVNPPWRQFNRHIRWGREPGESISGEKAATLLSEELSGSEDKIILVCLGPLSNIGKLVSENATLLPKIERIIWYNESVNPLMGFNYECDKDAAEVVLKSKVRIDIISNLHYDGMLFDTVLYNLCSRSGSTLGKVLYNAHNQPEVLEKMRQDHFRLCDELVALYLTNPELFGINTITSRINIRYNKDYNADGVREAIDDMITGIYVKEHNIIFNRFPDRREMFNYDVRPIVDSAIALYGPDEWKANVMTDEFHGHLGVFSIVGAKMGIRARELFGATPDMLDVITFAGTKPPYSCLNDGIQVSTGATLGMGTIHLSTDSITSPKAIFTFKDRSVMISLKEEYLKKVEADINEGIVKFGLMDDGYWKLVRRNALKYWIEWDRGKIFDITEITPVE